PPRPAAARRRLVRRLLWPPRPWGRGAAPVAGPYTVATGWWRGEGAREELYAAHRAALLWLQRDPASGRLHLQGWVA
ncbi:MAG: hypothetical protein D6739_02460, partial [Nitrospirae bacterium]